MIKTDITAYVNSYEYSCEIIVPSVVMTSTAQDEELNLSYTPNFTLKLNDAYSYINDTVEVSFSYGDTDYTAYANVVNRNAGVVTLQYADGLTSYVQPEPPVVHTLEFSYSTLSTSRDNYTNEYVISDRYNVLYDGEPITLTNNSIKGCTYCSATIYQLGGSTVCAKTGLEVGEYTDNIYCSYDGLTAYCSVNVTIIDSTPVVHTLEFSHAEPFYTYYDKYTDTITQSESTYLLYDGNKVEHPMTYLDNQMGLGGSYTLGIPTLNSIYWIPNSASKNNEVGEYSDRFTATYEGLTTYCDVTAVISDSTPEP